MCIYTYICLYIQRREEQKEKSHCSSAFASLPFLRIAFWKMCNFLVSVAWRCCVSAVYSLFAQKHFFYMFIATLSDEIRFVSFRVNYKMRRSFTIQLVFNNKRKKYLTRNKTAIKLNWYRYIFCVSFMFIHYAVKRYTNCGFFCFYNGQRQLHHECGTEIRFKCSLGMKITPRNEFGYSRSWIL